MPESHRVTESEVSDWLDEERQKWIRFAGSFGQGSDKTLEVQISVITPVYRVTDHGRDIYIGVLKETAVREYNALT